MGVLSFLKKKKKKVDVYSLSNPQAGYSQSTPKDLPQSSNIPTGSAYNLPGVKPLPPDAPVNKIIPTGNKPPRSGGSSGGRGGGGSTTPTPTQPAETPNMSIPSQGVNKNNLPFLNKPLNNNLLFLNNAGLGYTNRPNTGSSSTLILRNNSRAFSIEEVPKNLAAYGSNLVQSYAARRDQAKGIKRLALRGGTIAASFSNFLVFQTPYTITQAAKYLFTDPIGTTKTVGKAVVTPSTYTKIYTNVVSGAKKDPDIFIGQVLAAVTPIKIPKITKAKTIGTDLKATKSFSYEVESVLTKANKEKVELLNYNKALNYELKLDRAATELRNTYPFIKTASKTISSSLDLPKQIPAAIKNTASTIKSRASKGIKDIKNEAVGNYNKQFNFLSAEGRNLNPREAIQYSKFNRPGGFLGTPRNPLLPQLRRKIGNEIDNLTNRFGGSFNNYLNIKLGSPRNLNPREAIQYSKFNRPGGFLGTPRNPLLPQIKSNIKSSIDNIAAYGKGKIQNTLNIKLGSPRNLNPREAIQYSKFNRPGGFLGTPRNPLLPRIKSNISKELKGLADYSKNKLSYDLDIAKTQYNKLGLNINKNINRYSVLGTYKTINPFNQRTARPGGFLGTPRNPLLPQIKSSISRNIDYTNKFILGKSKNFKDRFFGPLNNPIYNRVGGAIGTDNRKGIIARTSEPILNRVSDVNSYISKKTTHFSNIFGGQISKAKFNLSALQRAIYPRTLYSRRLAKTNRIKAKDKVFIFSSGSVPVKKIRTASEILIKDKPAESGSINVPSYNNYLILNQREKSAYEGLNMYELTTEYAPRYKGNVVASTLENAKQENININFLKIKQSYKEDNIKVTDDFMSKNNIIKNYNTLVYNPTTIASGIKDNIVERQRGGQRERITPRQQEDILNKQSDRLSDRTLQAQRLLERQKYIQKNKLEFQPRLKKVRFFMPELKDKIKVSGLGKELGYKVFIKRGGRERELPGIFGKGEALEKLQRTLLSSLAARGGIKKTASLVNTKGPLGKINLRLFRPYKIRNRKAIPLVNEYIQRRTKRLFTPLEKSEIQRSRGRWL